MLVFEPQFRLDYSVFTMSSENCPICLKGLEVETTKSLSCDSRHVFHKDCINYWLRDRNYCPLCRTIVAPETLPTRRESINLMLGQDVPPSLVSKAQQLGLPSFNAMPERYENDSLLELIYSHGDFCMIVAYQTKNWIPNEWMTDANVVANDAELYDQLNNGYWACIVTKGLNAPLGLKLCPVCKLFISNLIDLSANNRCIHPKISSQ